MIIVRQGLANEPYSCIMQPFPGGVVKKDDIVKCIDPRNNHAVTGICVDHWTFMWAYLPDFFCQEAYGIDALTMYKTLTGELNSEARNMSGFAKSNLSSNGCTRSY